WDHASGFKGRYKSAGDRFVVAAQSVHVFFRNRRITGRPRLECEWSRGFATNAGAGETRTAEGYLRHVAARSDPASKHQRSSTDDSINDAGGREGGRRIRSV